MSKTTKKILTSEEMLSAEDIEYAEVEVFGGIVRLGSIDAGTMIEFQEQQNTPAKKTAGLRLIIQSVVDAEGNRIGNWPKDLERWKKRSQKACEKIVGAILKLNGLGDTAKKALSAAVRATVADKLALEISQLGSTDEDTVKALVNRVLDEAVTGDEPKND